MTENTFDMNGKQHRIVGRRVRDADGSFGERVYNVLQVRCSLLGIIRWWHEVDREEVPGHALISLGCVGDAGGWTSRLFAMRDGSSAA